jgi:hypothetical protein
MCSFFSTTMKDTHYIADDAPDDLIVSDDELEDSREEQQDVKVRPPWSRWYNQYFGLLEGASDDHDSDAIVCAGWDEPKNISADHDYYPDVSQYQCDYFSDED